MNQTVTWRALLLTSVASVLATLGIDGSMPAAEEAGTADGN